MFAIILLSLLATGCGRPLGRAGDPARPQPDRSRRQCPGDLILVDVGPASDRGGPAAAGATATGSLEAVVPAAAIEASRHFTVATRVIRRSAPGSDPLGHPASDTAAAASNATLVEGTGVVIDKEGLILTNHHVIRQADDLRVWVPQSGWMPARLVGEDPLNDLAVLSVDGPLPCVARLADAGQVRLGQPVAAVGYTPGLEPERGLTTLTGQLSSLGKSLQIALDPTQSHYYGNLLESTVPLSPGHSGGALLDATGAVVGINTAAVTMRYSSRRVGYAIPMSDYIRGIVARLARGEPIAHGYLGVMVCSCDRQGAGVVVEEVLPDSPAAEAGLEPGDAIIRVDHTNVRTAVQLAELVRSRPVNSEVPFRVSRGASIVEAVVTLSPRR